MELAFLVISSGYSSGESVLKLIGLIILCFVIIAASYFVTRFIGKRQQGSYGGSEFESLEVFRLSQNKYLQLVRIGKRYFVLAVCKDTVTVVTELTEEEMTPKVKGEKKSFKEIISQAVKADKAPEDSSQ